MKDRHIRRVLIGAVGAVLLTVTGLALAAPALAAPTASTLGSVFVAGSPAQEQVVVAASGLPANATVDYALYQSGTCAAPGTAFPINPTSGNANGSGVIDPAVTATLPSASSTGTGVACLTSPTNAFSTLQTNFTYGAPDVTLVTAQLLANQILEVHVVGVRFPTILGCGLQYFSAGNANATTPDGSFDVSSASGVVWTSPTVTWRIDCASSTVWGPVTTDVTPFSGTSSPPPSSTPPSSTPPSSTTTSSHPATSKSASHTTVVSVPSVSFEATTNGPAAETGCIRPASHAVSATLVGGVGGAVLMLLLGVGVRHRRAVTRRH
ncbi:MAG TPA: hypothetical protein VKQ07_00700 [Jatrophihabitantaceae bacterium]|nr:hypothetical protein [Jatrophihabitantaceae bacterium]